MEKRHEYITYHLEQADESLVSAALWLGAHKPNSYLNRLFFSYIYAMWAMLVAEGDDPRNRVAIVRRFRKDFIDTGRIPSDMVDSFENLAKYHKSLGGDFTDMAKEKPHEIAGWLEDARCFVNYAKETLGPQQPDDEPHP